MKYRYRMKYRVERNIKYDFLGQSYDTNSFPNLHKYPATMIPQIGVAVLNDIHGSFNRMLDPYCGSGSSFASGLAYGLRSFSGFDINPLAVEISKAKLTKIDMSAAERIVKWLRKTAYSKAGDGFHDIKIDKFNNFDYWFNEEVAASLQMLKNLIYEIKNRDIRRFALLALSSTMRDCSYVRNNEFKLYRMKEKQLLLFNPDVLCIFFQTLDNFINIYKQHYLPFLDNVEVHINNQPFELEKQSYDIVLSSPPYGDSKTTVAYGQFSMFSNSWAFDIDDARSLDRRMMGGVASKEIVKLNSVIDTQIQQIESESIQRAKEVNSFYIDLSRSISDVSDAVSKDGFSIYIVGNRTVKGVNLRTDQFIAEQFENNGFKHIVTYERTISNKRMPKLNSPTNIAGNKASTMNSEFIVISQK